MRLNYWLIAISSILLFFDYCLHTGTINGVTSLSLSIFLLLCFVAMINMDRLDALQKAYDAHMNHWHGKLPKPPKAKKEEDIWGYN